MFYPGIYSHNTLAGRAIGSGTFTTNGASNPVVIGGDVAQVLRLTDGVNAFFRVRLSQERDLGLGGAVLQVTVRGTDPATNHLTVNEGPMVANPALARRDDEFDIVLRNAGAVTDLAGQRIEFVYHCQAV